MSFKEGDCVDYDKRGPWSITGIDDKGITINRCTVRVSGSVETHNLLDEILTVPPADYHRISLLNPIGVKE